MAVLVVAEHDDFAIHAATLHALGAARKIAEAANEEIVLLVAGGSPRAAANEGAKLEGVTRVLCVEATHYADRGPENFAALVVRVVAERGFTHLLAPASGFGRNVMPRIAAALDVEHVSDLVGVISPEVFVRTIYAGNVVATIKSLDPIKVLTVRTTAFDPVGSDGEAELERTAPGPDLGLSKVIGSTLNRSERPELGAAKIIVSGGRGLGSGEDYQSILGPLADRLGAALGASRAAVDAGFVPNDLQIGQTGKIVAPQLYLAIGISGAIQHLAGMKDSKVIVAINKDPDAPIFQVADYGLVADLFAAVPELTATLGAL